MWTWNKRRGKGRDMGIPKGTVPLPPTAWFHLNLAWHSHSAKWLLEGDSVEPLQTLFCSLCAQLISLRHWQSNSAVKFSSIFNAEWSATLTIYDHLLWMFKALLHIACITVRLLIKVCTFMLKSFGHLFISERTGIQVRHNDRVWGLPLDSSPSRIYCTRMCPAHL